MNKQGFGSVKVLSMVGILSCEGIQPYKINTAPEGYSMFVYKHTSRYLEVKEMYKGLRYIYKICPRKYAKTMYNLIKKHPYNRV